MRLKKTVKLLLAQVFYYSGIAGFIRRHRPCKGVKILAYHRVNRPRMDPLGMAISPRDFAIHMSYLAASYKVISMSQAVESLGQDLANTVVVSFDDGYADNYFNAFPVLKRNALPAIVFLTAGPIDERGHLWYDQVVQALITCQSSSLDLSAFGLGRWTVATQQQKLRAARFLVHYAKKNLDQSQLRMLLQLLEEQGNGGKGIASEMMTWDQINEMKNSGIEFGAHTLTHVILSGVEREVQVEEIQKSREIIERHTGKPVVFFAYPNGEADDFTSETIDLLKSAGFQAACTLIPGWNTGGDPFVLKRIGVDEDFTGYGSFGTKAIFACELAGLFDFFLLRRRSPEREHGNEHIPAGRNSEKAG